MFQDLYDRAKMMIKKAAFMKFYDVSGPLYLETDASGIVLWAWFLQARDCMNCDNNEVPDNATLHPVAFVKLSLLNAEQHNNNIE